MFEKMLVAIDGSDAGREALLAAERIGHANGAAVVVVHVLVHKVTWVASVDVESDAEAQTFVESAARDLTAAGLAASWEVLRAPTDQVAEEIVRAAEANDCSLIVMGTHGFGDARSLAMGSVAHAVVRHARCPVLLVPRGTMALDEPASAPASAETS